MHAALVMLEREFAPNPDDALQHECVGIEVIEGCPDFDTVPGALREYFADEYGSASSLM